MEQLQRVFKTFSDSTRVRILALLESEELAVQELMEVLGMAQSRVSRHLGILREAGLLTDRRDGTYVFYRFALPEGGPWRETWKLVKASSERDATLQRDRAALAQVISARASTTRRFFDNVGPEWDVLRKVFNDEALRARAITRLVPQNLVVADIGTGTGILASELARLGVRVIGVDHSDRMLDAAREKLDPDLRERVDLRRGEAGALPIEDEEVDAAFAHMVLHYLPSPAEAIREMARVVAPGGVVTIVDFVSHDREWMRDELGVTWLGFETNEVASWFADAGLDSPDFELQQSPTASRNLPTTFIASARKPPRAT
jgi:ArsR family transcriptional regulator